MRTLSLAVLFLIPSIASGAFRCVDEKGATHFEETPPAACATVPIVEVSRSGAVVRTIAPSAAPAAAAAAREEGKATAAADRARVDQKRRDRALQDSYTSASEIDQARDRNLEIIRGRINAVQLRLKQVSQRESDLDRTLQSFKGRTPPERAIRDLESVREEKRAIEASAGRLDQDLQQTRNRFEADKARWIELHEPR